MEQRTIRNFRRRFIISAMVSLILVMSLIASLIYLINLTATRNQIRETMDYIAANNETIRDTRVLYASGSADADARDTPVPSGQPADNLRRGSYDMRDFFRDVTGSQNETDPEEDSESGNPEDDYSISYFAVRYDAEGNVTLITANHMEDLTAEDALALAGYACSRIMQLGSYGDYYYNVRTEEDGTQMVIYLHSENQVHSTARLLYSALLLIGAGSLIIFLFVWLLSTRAIEPMIRNAELQQQFITNASHELKTPLAVIRANTEMQELEGGESEWTSSTLRQVDRMSALIQNLVTITRAQESESPVRQSMDISPIVSETADAYLPVALQDGKELEKDIPSGIRMKASEPEIRQLVTLLLDNAVKYCDANGSIRVSLYQKSRETILIVSNTFAAGKDIDYSRFFERFYRGDESHTIEGSSGFGIGLSIAGNLTQSYGGSIRAEWQDDIISFVCVLR